MLEYLHEVDYVWRLAQIVGLFLLAWGGLYVAMLSFQENRTARGTFFVMFALYMCVRVGIAAATKEIYL